MAHGVDVDHFAPNFVLLEGGLNVVSLPGGGGRVFPFSSVHDEAGRVTSGDHVEPASYANFAITSHLVVVPTFGSPHDDDGVAAIAELFPDRATIGVRGDAVLAGGGGFHCASQQMPKAQNES